MKMANVSRYGSKWSHDETVLALGLYFQIPFAKVNKTHPEVVKLAHAMNRSPASLSMKIGNIGRFDPTLAAQGITGLPNGAKEEKIVWDEYDGHREELADEYQRLRCDLENGVRIESDEIIKTPPGLDRVRLTRYRVNQTFFRTSVLSAYDGKCCITGIAYPELLVASHIKPWASCQDGNERTDTRNGLCLNALHDRAFDRGLITIDDDYRIVLSKKIKDALPHEVYINSFLRLEGHKITLPHRGVPSKEFLQHHRHFVFVGG